MRHIAKYLKKYQHKYIPDEPIRPIVQRPALSENKITKMKKIHKLCLIEAKEIHFTGKDTGEDVTTWKYTFLDKDNKIIVGYRPNNEYAKEVCGDGEYSESKAKDFPFEGRLWDNQIKWRLASKRV